MHVSDDSGTPAATYIVTTSGGCWHAVKTADLPGAENRPPAKAHGCLHLSDNDFPWR